MLYIDFDGVILDTEPLLFKEWRKNPSRHLLPETEKIRYMQKANWEHILNNSKVINDSIYYLTQLDPSTSFILTKVHSMENEGKAKVEWIRNSGIKQNIILVPYYFKKSDIVVAKNNILIDDCLKNLREWKECGGKVIFFDKDDDDFDSWHEYNTNKYSKVLSLSSFVSNRSNLK